MKGLTHKRRAEKVNQGKQKLLNYLDSFIELDYFQNEIKTLREKFNIPKNGFNLSEELKKEITRNVMIEAPFHIPVELENKKLELMKPINLAIREVSSKFPINDYAIISLFKIYLFYNIKLYECLDGLGEINLCRTEDVKEELEEYSFLAPSDEVVRIFKRKFNDYPVVIKLHPSISQRDLLAYIKDYWHLIRYYLSQYKDKKSKLGKIKRKKSSIKERNKFIYENRNLPRKKIMQLVADKFKEILDYGHIGKIISLEKKRRKEV